MNKEGQGDYAFAFSEGVLELRKYSKTAMDKVKAEGSRRNFLLNANYTIEEGVLYIKGDAAFSAEIYGGDLGINDFEGTQELVQEMAKEYFISSNKITNKKKWWSSNTNWVIERGYYLKQKTSAANYKASNFLIIE